MCAYFFRNTTELEASGILSSCSPEQQIQIVGGLSKAKYSSKYYDERVTYTAAQLKVMLSSFKQIEGAVNPNWTQLQKAYFVHKILAQRISYEPGEITKNSSNLTGIVTGRSVCAGYSLIYKEIMDRMGIPCDYIRGHAGNEKHAWNTLNINGQAIAVDLTWNASEQRSGSKYPQYFGMGSEFYDSHFPDPDEKGYAYTPINSKDIQKLDISISQPHQQEQKPRQVAQRQTSQSKRSFATIISREQGSKVAIGLCGEKLVNGEKIYKYAIAECYNGTFHNPRIVYSETLVPDLGAFEAVQFASKILAPSRLERYYEHCEDENRDIQDPNSFENHGGYLGCLDSNGRKRVNTEIIGRFENNFTTMHRNDHTSLVVQMKDAPQGQNVPVNKYDCYEFVLDNRNRPVLCSDVIYSENNFLHLSNAEKTAISAQLLSRQNIGQSLSKSHGYVGHIKRNVLGRFTVETSKQAERACSTMEMSR